MHCITNNENIKFFKSPNRILEKKLMLWTAEAT